MKFYAWLCPLIAMSIIAIAYAYATKPLWIFLSLGIAVLMSLLGILNCFILLVQKNQSKLKTLFYLAANSCVTVVSVFYLFGAIVIGVGFAI